MKLVDVNIPLYAVNQADPRHSIVLKWWESALNSNEPVGLCWMTLIAFVRIATQSKIIPQPLSMADSVGRVNAWLSHLNVELVVESRQHWQILGGLLSQVGLTHRYVTDAHLAAIAIGAGATLVSCDTDFARFPGLRWENPLLESR